MLFRMLLSIVLLLPTALVEQSSADSKAGDSGSHTSPPPLRNVELTKAGSLHVQVIDSLGNPLAAIPVHVMCADRQLSTVTNQSGRVDVPELHGGTCLLSIDEQMFACRVWRHGTAPPKSLQSIALVNEDSTVVRGNHFGRRPACPPNGCDPCEQTRCLSSEAKYGLLITALGGTAAYMALSRDNGS